MTDKSLRDSVTIAITALLVISSIAGVAGMSAAQEQQTVAAQQSGVEVAYTQFGAGGSISYSSDGVMEYSETLYVDSVGDTNLTLGGSDTYSLRVVKENSGTSLTITPNTSETYSVSEVEIDQDIVTGSSPTLSGETIDGNFTQISVNTSGNESIFSETLAAYSVQVLNSTGTVISETEFSKHAADYQTSVRYNGSAIAFTKHPDIDSGFRAEFTQYETDTSIDVSFNKSDEYFVVPLNGTDFVLNESFGLDVYPAGSDVLGERVLSLAIFPSMTDNIQHVDGPVTNGTVTNESETGQEQSTYEIQYVDNPTGSATHPTNGTNTLTYSTNFDIETTGSDLTIGGNSSYQFRVVRQDTGEAMTITPETNESVSVTEARIDADLPIRTNRDISVRLANGTYDQVPVSVDGNYSMFNDTFAPYSVQLIYENGTVVSETASEDRMVGYESEVRYNGSAIAFNKSSAVGTEYSVELSQPLTGVSKNMSVTESGEFFVASVEGTNFTLDEHFSLTFSATGEQQEEYTVGELFMFSSMSEYVVQVNGSLASESESALDQYAGADNQIQTSELQDIVTAWSLGELETTQLQQAVKAWALGSTV